jgi:hypothetical protein
VKKRPNDKGFVFYHTIMSNPAANTSTHRGYTIFKQPQGGYYICGIKVVMPKLDDAVKYIDDYLSKNDKARQASLVKQAKM